MRIAWRSAVDPAILAGEPVDAGMAAADPAPTATAIAVTKLGHFIVVVRAGATILVTTMTEIH